MSHLEHQSHAAAQPSPRVAILTLSDSRSPATDISGDAIARELQSHGCTIAARSLIPDDPHALAQQLDTWLSDASIDAILTTGGTGISPRDQTMPVITRLLDVELPGFGELFRMLSWQQVGAAAMLSRAAGGIARGKPLFALPGSTNAVTLATRDLIAPQLKHLLSQLRRNQSA